MKNLLLSISCLFAVSAWAGAPLSAADAIKAQKDVGASCPASERGKVTKVDVVDAQGVQKLTHGGMKAAPGKYLVVYAAKGSRTDFSISSAAIDDKAVVADFKPLIGTPACLPADDEE